jgi:hypothetical protein
MAPDLPKAAVPWWQRYRMPWQRAAALVVALVLMGACLSGSLGRPGLSLSTVYYATQGIHLRVPSVWAREFHLAREARPVAAEAGAGPGLLVATDTEDWDSVETASYGVYATVVQDEPDLSGIADAVPCGSLPEERPLDTGEWEGTVWDWPECHGNGSLSSAAVQEPGDPTTVYMEIRQPSYRPDLVNEIIDSTYVS